MNVRVAFALLAFVLSTSAIAGDEPDRDRAYSPEDASKRMKLAEGLAVRPFASEPIVRQPVAIDFDDRGRLWVVQYLQYPNPAGLSRVKVDRFSRTTYDRRPEPPPFGPKGLDRLTILEDRDRDGRVDSSRDFVAGLNLTSGFAFGNGGVYVLQIPYLLFYPDRNRDDVPDANPEVLLTGFGMEDAHSVANSLTWGPDGKLYGLQGSTVTADIRGISFQQGVWRYDPRSKEFELFSEGGGNMWGLDFDRHGRLLASTNVGGWSVLHAMQGAYYWKQFGKHGPLHNPYTYGYFDHVPHRGLEGGHVTVGGLFYEADAFPTKYRGNLIAGDLLGHMVHRHSLEPAGSTFKASRLGEILIANDSWFATSDLTLGPDGAVYVADWHDKRTAHPDPDADWDRSNGRILAVEPKSPKPLEPFDLQAKSSDDLVQMLSHRNVWFIRRARRILGERGDRSILPKLFDLARNDSDPRLQLEAFWTIALIGGLDDVSARDFLGHPDEHIRAWVVRLLGDKREISREISARFVKLAETDPSPIVRAQLAATAKRLKAEDAIGIARAMVLRDADASDPFIPMLLWWAVERHAVANASMTIDALADDPARASRLNRSHLIDRLMRRFLDEPDGRGESGAVGLLARCKEPDLRNGLVATIADLSRPRNPTSTPDALRDAIGSLWKSDRNNAVLLRAAARLGDEDARLKVARDAADSARSNQERVELIRLLGVFSEEAAAPTLLKLASGPEANPIRLAALGALGRFRGDSIGSTISSAYLDPNKDAAWRASARELLLGRASWAARFLSRVDRGELKPAEIPVEQLARLAEHHNDGLDSLVRKHWGRLTGGTPEEKLAEVRRLNNDVRAAAGNRESGRALFSKHCASCHRLFGEGKTVGPDLTFANRKDRQYLLVSLVDPSSVIRKEYQARVVETKDGRVLSGLIVEESPTKIVLAKSNDERVEVARGDVENVKDSPISLMTEGLYREFTPAQLRDLFAYLEGDAPR